MSHLSFTVRTKQPPPEPPEQNLSPCPVCWIIFAVAGASAFAAIWFAFS
jgi:hypothetical protein